jgi:type II secretory pathway predicted ATPase ExeA
VYLEHFNLKCNPFDQLADPDFLYLTEQHKEALARMQFALAINDSFTIITGEVGSGKTTLVRKMLSDFAEECRPVFITHTRLNDIELLQMILIELGVEPYEMGKIQLLHKLHQIVDSERDNGRRIVLIVDEAQNFSAPLLEELRLLTCMDSEKSRSVNIVLVGQPQLGRTLASPDLDQLRQRCRLRFHLNALSAAETPEYIRHRLAIAEGNADEIFDEETISSIHGYTRGVPRLVNTLCDTAMIMAYTSKRNRVTSESIDDAVKELAWSKPASPCNASGFDELGAESTGLLTISENGVVCCEYTLNMQSYIIGRSEDCSIVINSAYLSRHHALLAHDSDGWAISDLNSTNGITVNDSSVRVGRLKHGDLIGIGNNLMRLTLDASRDSVFVEDESTDLYTGLPDLNAL